MSEESKQAQAQQENNPDAGRLSDKERESAAAKVAEHREAFKRGAPDFGDNDLGQKEVQERMDVATEQGFVGASVDPTPDENYSLLTPDDAPTPETDPGLAEDARAASHGNRLRNVEVPSHVTAGRDREKSSSSSSGSAKEK